MAVSFADQITALSEQLVEIKGQIANLAAENARLRAQASSPLARIRDHGDESAPTRWSRRGLLAAGASGATAAGLLIAVRATPAVAANGDAVLLGDSTNSATADTVLTTTSSTGLKVESTDTAGTGVFGLASAASSPQAVYGVRGEARGVNLSAGVFGEASWVGSGQNYGVYGHSRADGGTGVYGLANGPGGGTCGVQGDALGTGVYGHSSQMHGQAYGVRGQCDSDGGTGVQGTATATTAGGMIGVEGSAAGPGGKGVYGHANAIAGATTGVEGSAASAAGKGVYGHATAGSGTTYGVYGQTNSPSGYALYAQGRLKVTGRSFLGTPNSAPTDADLGLGSISFYLDQTNNRLKVRVKYSTGVLKTATIALV
jgi:hypothetical protein